MLPSDGKIPGAIGLFLVERQPSDDDFQLLPGQRAREQFTVDAQHRLMLAIIDMDMGLVVLFDVKNSM